LLALSSKFAIKKNCEGAVGLLSLIVAEEFNMPPLFSEMGKIDYNGLDICFDK